MQDGDAAGAVRLPARRRWPSATTTGCAGWSTRSPRRRPSERPALGIEALTLALDRRYPTGDKKRSSVLTILRGGLERIFDAPAAVRRRGRRHAIARITWETREPLRGPQRARKTLLIDARGFPPEGEDCDATLARQGLSPRLAAPHPLQHAAARGSTASASARSTDGLRIDCYDNPGDYLASGMDGLEIYVHGNAQDQLCQIAKRGKLVVYGDVGQTFLYGAKGGEIYVLGNAAGRPMINAVGRPRVVINGTALDFLAESFMAGDPLRRRRLRDRQRHALRRGRQAACRWSCRTRAATCSRWPRAGRSTSATRTGRWSTSNSTAGRTGRCRPPTGN